MEENAVDDVGDFGPNDQLVLIAGISGDGKSASLRNIRNQEKWMYLNCEAGKKLPFRTKFKQYTITDPHQVFEAFDAAESMADVHTIVIDSLTYLLDMYESVYVLSAANGMQAWGQFVQYFKNLMQQYVAKSTKNVVFTAHTSDTLNEAEMLMETKVPVKGSLKNNGVSYFSSAVQ